MSLVLFILYVILLAVKLLLSPSSYYGCSSSSSSSSLLEIGGANNVTTRQERQRQPDNDDGNNNNNFTTTTFTRPYDPPSYWPKYGNERKVFVLDGIWNTSQLTDNQILKNFDSLDPYFDPSKILTPNTTIIPSTLDNIPPGYMGYRGVTFFRTYFKTTVTRKDDNDSINHTTIHNNNNNNNHRTAARILFQACSFYCRIWMNGIEIGDHKAGGYVAFWLDIPQSVLLLNKGMRKIPHVNQSATTTITDIPQYQQQHELFVLVDNRFNITTAPMHTGGDFWHYSGILRSVEYHVGPPNEVNWPWRVSVFPQSDLQSVQLHLELFHRYVSNLDTIEICFDDNPNTTIKMTLSSSMMIQKRKYDTREGERGNILDLGLFKVPNPRIWSTINPQLHTITIKMNHAILTERFGLRYWDISYENDVLNDNTKPSNITTTSINRDSISPRIRLNGQIIKLVGWNHHTQWPYTGASPTNKQLDDDIQLIKQYGHVNFVRGAHYPQDPRWLDLLDEHGIVMWCETLGPGVKVDDLQSPYFLKYQQIQINEMLDNAINHPSIAFWAFFNEGPSDKQDACDGYNASSQTIQERDTTRFITYASNKPLHDKCYDTATVISHNGYPGWYNADKPKQFWNRIADYVATNISKPLIISETGAGGIYEWTHNDTITKWTLKYQSQILSEDVDTAISNPNISGICLWHFFDFKVDDKWQNNTSCDYLPNVTPPTCGYIDVDTTKASGRPGGLNHKGVLDYYRRPKPSFAIVAAKYKTITRPKYAIDTRFNS